MYYRIYVTWSSGCVTTDEAYDAKAALKSVCEWENTCGVVGVGGEGFANGKKIAHLRKTNGLWTLC